MKRRRRKRTINGWDQLLAQSSELQTSNRKGRALLDASGLLFGFDPDDGQRELPLKRKKRS